MWKSLQLAARVLRKNPAFTVIAVLTIALGVGASTAIFSVTNAVLLRPLPYPHSDELVVGGMDLTKRNVHGLPFSNADYLDLKNGTRQQFSDMAGVFSFEVVAEKTDGTPEPFTMAVVTTNFFNVMGAQIVSGRDFNQQDGIPQAAAPAPGTGQQGTAPPQLPQMAILSHEYFMKRYGGNPAVLGHTLGNAGGPNAVIVGVLAPGFRLYFPPEDQIQESPDVWVANRLDYAAADRNNFSIIPVGRLKPGVTLQQAQAGADAVAREGRQTIPMDASIGYEISLAPMRQHLVAAVQPAILALMGSVIFLLLIACANVANLLLVRASLREQEFAVRAAMGANRRQLIRPLMTEACLLAVGGTALGLGLAWAAIGELRHLAPTNLPRLDSVGLDMPVLIFAALAGLVAAVLFGLAPAWRASQPTLMNVLRGASRTSGLASGAFLRNGVVMAEVAASFVLLVGSGLMFRSFMDLQRIDPGFDAHNLLTFRLLGAAGTGGKTPDEREAKMRQVKAALQAIPGVESVTASTPFPLTGGYSPVRWGTEAALADPSKFQATNLQIVIPGYFETMHAPLLAGRTFTEDDEQPGRNYVMVDEDLAKKAFPGQSAVGKRILTRVQTPQAVFVQIIGVVAHQREESLAVRGREEIYFTDAYFGGFTPPRWAIRTRSDPAGYEGEVRAAIAGLSHSYLVDKIEPAETVVQAAQAETRFSLLLLLVFAIIAGTLAGIGLYGVLATAVRQRTPEIGVRMALGADRGDIVRLVVRQGMQLSLIGIAVGIVAALVLGRVMTAMLVGVKATDPVTFVGMAAAFLAIAALASWLPARRAAGLDPKTALHEQ